MLKYKTTFICLVILLAGFQSGIAGNANYVMGEVIIQLEGDYSIDHITRLHSGIDGILTDLRVKKVISVDMKMYLLQFDGQHFSVNKIIEELEMHPGVSIAQVNHILTYRSTLPNDPQIGSQWQYVNTGVNGGVIDADIDADEAWDITTGGLTVLGDTIVVCIIDGGLDLSHQDFADNIWINHAEIPNNGLDDDNNGYIDDYNGWNTYNLNDNISGGGHGTSVAGIVGAKGNNSIGVSGVNWNVKLMIIVGGGNEADALAAYSYPLVMRKKYNATNGAEGAFVVATNASWGIDFGQPSSAPLWCAMYDSLGKYGILNCGATINGNQNVDIVGDLPTACPSDYLISVTNMNNQDVKVTNAGYGATTIDLGAHGANVYTVDFGNSYGGFGGTSGATPHVTGAIALLYSAPCPTLIAFAKTYPDSAARLMRSFILDGVDPNASLSGITTTGGRLNLYNSLLELLNYDCMGGDCFPAYALNTSNVTDTSASLSWSALPSADSFNIEYRKVGSPSWIVTSSLTLTTNLTSLVPCNTYEFRVKSFCDTSSAVFSNIITFQTDGCCEPPVGIITTSVTETTATFTWNSLLSAISYNVRYRKTGNTSWTTINSITVPSVTITGLDTCNDYEIQFQTVCDTGMTIFTTSTIFETTGCTGCPIVVYCPATSLNSGDEWIEEITVSTLTNTSGNDGGYGDHTALSTELFVDSTYSFTFTPGFAFTPFNEYWLAWIDFNQDGDFDDFDEEIFDSGNADDLPKSGQFNIPSNAISGNTRMRINMRFNDPATACMNGFDFGEVEDYCVKISHKDQDTISGIQNPVNGINNIAVYPNPFSEEIIIRFNSTNRSTVKIKLINTLGATVFSAFENEVIPGTNQISIRQPNLSSGIYLLQLTTEQSRLSRKLIKN